MGRIKLFHVRMAAGQGSDHTVSRTDGRDADEDAAAPLRTKPIQIWIAAAQRRPRPEEEEYFIIFYQNNDLVPKKGSKWGQKRV